MRRLVVASNRTASPGEPPTGGLAVAIADALAERGGGLWFGWSGETTDGAAGPVRQVRNGAYDLALADLTESEHQGFYLGFANRALWAVLHYRVDLAAFDDAEFATYAAVNDRFGRLLAQRIAPGDIVWVHDYQFLLMGQALRDSGWDGPLGFFLHVPFPPPEVFSALPQHLVILRALAAFDLLGFQTERDAQNFRRCMVDLLGGAATGDRVAIDGRTLRTGAFPIGIDAGEMSRLAADAPARDAAARVGKVTDGRALVIGVDRMDYSKGLPQRLLAFGRLLDEHEHLRGRVNLIQIAPPSRESVEAYRALRDELDGLAGRVNGDYSDLDWTPIRYLARGYPREVLAGLYRLARVGLVTPLHDGMNLVAKEYVAAQDPLDPGVLVLSAFAGAAERMEAALIVNPHDVGATADAIRQALEMPLAERRERWRALDVEVRVNDVAVWRQGFLRALDAVGSVAA